MSNHPITPPEELLQSTWDILRENQCTQEIDEGLAWKMAITQAVQWGADQELEACCEVMRVNGDYVSGGVLRAIRRPKPPPTLKERALQLLETYYTSGVMLTADQVATIRRALETLND
jgi:hypothetical protein